MKQSKRYSSQVRERAVRLVFDHQAEYASQCAAIGSIADARDGGLYRRLNTTVSSTDTAPPG